MLASVLLQLTTALSKVNQYILDDDIESAQIKLSSLDATLKELFNSSTTFTQEEMLFLSDFSTQLNTSILNIAHKKDALAKKLGTHLNTQKKINVYKSIK